MLISSGRCAWVGDTEMTETVLLERDGDVATVILNRP